MSAPALRFKDDEGREFPEWRNSQLGNICSITTGKLDANAMVEGGQYRFYTCAKNYYWIDDYAFDTDALLISGNGANVGYIHRYKGKFNAYQRTYVLDKFDQNINFVKCFLDANLYARIFTEKKEGNTPYIVMGTLTDMEIQLPAIPEQTKIANFLTAVDEKLAQLARKHDLLTQYKKGVMQQIFSQELRFKDDNGREFAEWEDTSIGKALTIGSGKDYKHLSAGEIPVYGTGGYMLSVDKYLYDGESVCIGRKGTIDKPVLLTGKFWTVDTLFYTHSFKNCLPKFIYAYFQTVDWKNYNEASGVPSLSKSTIEKIAIQIPCVAEQTKIANFLTAIDDKITATQTQLAAVKQYKQGLLQQMFV